MIHRRSIGFKELFSRLPKEIQAQARERFELLKVNPAHPQLHFKEFKSGKLEQNATFSVRITGGYRALGTEVVSKPQVIVWWFVGDHSAYERVMTKSYKK
jgi:hypothetical protein